MRNIILFFVAVFSLISCRNSHSGNNDARPPSANDKLVYSILFNNYSAEYRALAYQAFNIAGKRLIEESRKTANTNNLAVVVDIDETLLNNSPYQAFLVHSGRSYPENWNEWCNLAEADAVPGAVGFLQQADSLGFAIFYISNRKEEFVAEGTLENLENLGFPQLTSEHIMLRMPFSESNPEPSSKVLRRNEVFEYGYKIFLLVGDNLGDFFRDSPDSGERLNQTDSLKQLFGDRFIVLPNAMYGNWVNSLRLTEETVTDSLIERMVPGFK